MKVRLRKRNQGGKDSLYLDYYHRGKRKTETLNLYLHPKPKDRTERNENKETFRLAEAICAKRQIEAISNTHGFTDTERMNASLFVYIEQLIRKRSGSSGNYGNWKSMFKHLKGYANQKTTFADVDYRFIDGFKEHLDNAARKKNNEPLSQNSKYSYFNKFRAALKQAVKDGILTRNRTEGVEGFKQSEPQREFLTLEELDAVALKQCDIPQLKRAFLFSCLTGMRWSDIQKLVWSEVQHSSNLGYYVRFRQKKTKGAETLYISDQAVSLLGERGDSDDRVFKGLKYSSWHNMKLQQWMMRAGVSKTITFHCARHTYATQQLGAGTDIYTVSNLLGHRELKTTQVYAKIIDEKKREAADKIKLTLIQN